MSNQNVSYPRDALIPDDGPWYGSNAIIGGEKSAPVINALGKGKWSTTTSIQGESSCDCKTLTVMSKIPGIDRTLAIKAEGTFDAGKPLTPFTGVIGYNDPKDLLSATEAWAYIEPENDGFNLDNFGRSYGELRAAQVPNQHTAVGLVTWS